MMGSLVKCAQGESVFAPASAVSLLVVWGQVSPHPRTAPSLKSLSDYRDRGVTSNRLTPPLCWMSQTWQDGLEQAWFRGWSSAHARPPLGSPPHSPCPWGLGL